MDGIDFNNISDEDLQSLADEVDKSSVDDKQLQDLGFTNTPTQSQQQPKEEGLIDKAKKVADTLEIERPKDGKVYKESKWDWETIKDVGTSLGVEASHIFASKDHELQYESKTRAGEAFKYGYRYVVGTAMMFAPTGWVGAGLKAASKASLISKLPLAAKTLFGVSKFLEGSVVSTKGAVAFAKGKGISPKLGMIGAKAVNAATQGMAAGAAADFTLYRPEDNEGHLADMFGDTNNALIDLLQTKEDDTVFEAKLKNVVDGLIAGTFGGELMEFAGKPLFRGIEPIFTKSIKNLKGLVNAKTEKEATDAITQVLKDETVIDNLSDNATKIAKVKEIYEQSIQTGDDPTEAIINTFKTEDIEEAKSILKTFQDGDTFHMNDDGSYSIRVSNWEDASKVTKEEYLSQRTPQEKIFDMDSAVKSTMEQRKVVGTGDEHNLITYTKKGQRKGNNDTAKSIVNYYKDNWKLDNNIKVKFVDGIDGGLEGTTQTTEYLGKNTKGKKLSNHEILIDINTENPYAVLRSELEHIKNLEDGTLTKGEHRFPRYNNTTTEDEMAGEYVYKKSVGKKNKTSIREQDATTIQSESKNVLEKPVASSDSESISRRETTSNTTGEVEQLKLDFNTKVEEAKTPENITQEIKSGNINITSTDDVNTILDTIIKNDIDISGTKWVDISKDTDKWLKDNVIFSDNENLLKAFKKLASENDVESLDILTRKVLALQKISSGILEQIQHLTPDSDAEILLSLHSAVDAIKAYTKETGSASGRLLQARKLINIGKEVFGENRLSNVTLAGINTFSDILSKAIKDTFNTNFTVSEAYKQVYKNILNNADSDIIKSLYENPDFSNELSKIISKAVKTKDISTIEKEVHLYIAKEFAKEQQELALKATTKKGMWEVLSKNIQTYYITNLLSGLSTPIKNTVSGLINVGYTPAMKALAGALGDGGSHLTSEGLNSYKALTSSITEAWSLMKQAWIHGEGSLVSFKDEANADLLQGLRMTSFDDESLTLGQKIWNYYSMMSRAMVASDEFVTQLNYRMTARGKAYTYAESDLANGIIKAEQLDERAEEILKHFYDADGRPIDTDILYEAKSNVYQTNLDGSYVNPITGEEVQMREPTRVMRLLNTANKAANSNILAKLFMPFMRTGGNILQMNLDHNLLYQAGSDLTNYLTKNQKAKLLSNTREGALTRARCAFGIGTLGLGMMLASTGMVTGSAPSDPKERTALFKAGWRPYSVNIGGNWVSYQGYEPIHTMLGFAADMYNLTTAVKNADSDDRIQTFAGRMFSAIVNNFIDKAAFRTGLNQLAALTNPNRVEEAIKSFMQIPTGMLPESSFVRNISSLGGRDVTTPQGYERIFNNYFNRGLGDYRRDSFGNRQDIFGMIISNSTKDLSQLPEYAELIKLGHLGYKPKTITENIVGTKYKIKEFTDPETKRSCTDAMYEELSKLTINGKTLQEAVRDLVTDSYYKSLPKGIGDNVDWDSRPDDTKCKALNRIFLEYNNQAEQNVLENCSQFRNKKGETIEETKNRIEMEAINKTLNTNVQDAVDKIRSLF